MAQKRMRRCTLKVNGADITGVRDFTYDDNSEFTPDRGDNDAESTFVQMSVGPYPVSFELLARVAGCDTGYIGALVAVGKEVSVQNGVETVADRTWTFSDGYIKVGANLPTENPGRLPVKGEFKHMVAS